MYTDRKPGKEFDDTKASAANDRFEEIVKRVKDAGAEITSDESFPLQVEFNREIVETGDRRVVEFNLNRTDFQITRDIKNFRTVGEGNKRHLEEISSPMIETKLKRKPETSDQWLGVDLEDLF